MGQTASGRYLRVIYVPDPDDEVAREILKRLETLVPGTIKTQLTVETGSGALDIKSASDSEPVWKGVEFQGTYYVGRDRCLQWKIGLRFRVLRS